jgi:hypothetical protein
MCLNATKTKIVTRGKISTSSLDEVRKGKGLGEICPSLKL